MLPYGRKNPLPFHFSKRSPFSGLRQIRNKGNGIHKSGNLGVHPCSPARRQRRFRSLRKRPASPILLRPDSLIRLQRLRHIQYPLVCAAAKPQLDVLSAMINGPSTSKSNCPSSFSQRIAQLQQLLKRVPRVRHQVLALALQLTATMTTAVLPYRTARRPRTSHP